MMKFIVPVNDMFKVHSKQYKKVGDYSVTEILNPPRVVHLNIRHPNAEGPLMHQFASFVGTGVHKYAEYCLRKSKPNYDLERRMQHTVLDRLITGSFDVFLNGDVYDFKTCKTWKLVFDPEMEEWHEQQNIYAYFLGLEGINVNHLYIVAMYLDWVATTAERDAKYPQEPCLQYKLDIWEPFKTKDFLYNRVQLMIDHENTPDDELPECTKKERWEDPTKFACYKTDEHKRASRVFETLEEAITYMKSTKGFGAGSYIEVRHGIRKRCEKYCDVNEFCKYYKQYSSKVNRLETIPYEQV